MAQLASAGCPDVERKAVNAAKRLRKRMGVEETQVCSLCSRRVHGTRVNAQVGTDEQVGAGLGWGGNCIERTKNASSYDELQPPVNKSIQKFSETSNRFLFCMEFLDRQQHFLKMSIVPAFSPSVLLLFGGMVARGLVVTLRVRVSDRCPLPKSSV